MRRAAWVWWALFGASLVGCGEEGAVGVAEPLRVEGAFFRGGALPGVAPEGVDPDTVPGPKVTSVELASAIFHPWGPGHRVAGRVSPEGYAVAVALGDEGSGHWVMPVEGADALANDEQSFVLDASVGGASPGLHLLRLVAVDAEGEAGLQREVEVCVAAPIPDNLNACDPRIEPPAAVVSLRWDAQADVDLVLEGPGGEVLDARRPLGASVLGGAPAEVVRDPTVPRFERDSNAGCALDGRRRESVVFPQEPAPGTWLLKARLFEACGAPSAQAVLEVYRRLQHADGTWSLVLVTQAGTRFLASQADGGEGAPTYLLPLRFD